MSEAFLGYPSGTADFMRQLPAHGNDKNWHTKNSDTYHEVLREPTDRLFESIARRHIAPMDPNVADVPRRLSNLKKNDWGRGNYHSHFWGAFYDPQAGKKIESVQLFFLISGEEEHFRYGFGFGTDCQEYVNRFISTLRSDPARAGTILKGLANDCQVELEVRGAPRTYAPKAFAEQLGNREFIDELAKAKDPSIRIVKPLKDLSSRGADLADDVGKFFVDLWPFFEAARSGHFPPAAQPGRSAPTAIGDEGEEDAPESLAELAERTCVPETLLATMESALLAKGQLVLVGPPGTSKTFIAKEFARYFVRAEPGHRAQGPPPGIIYMHANWTYEDFFVGVRPKLNTDGFVFERREGALLRWIGQNSVVHGGNARAVVVLDELNRCDTAAVFGELLQLLEHRGETVSLMNGDLFVLPRDLYIVGTMNSADRSVGRMDLALRRRFYFFELYPRRDILEGWLRGDGARNPIGFEAGALDECNRILQEQYGIPREQHIGHALFMSSVGERDGSITLTQERLRQIVDFSVLPYVRELILERGRSPEPALDSIRALFARWLGPSPSVPA
jgi:uncharacterized protein (DUF2461 family)